MACGLFDGGGNDNYNGVGFLEDILNICDTGNIVFFGTEQFVFQSKLIDSLYKRCELYRNFPRKYICKLHLMLFFFNWQGFLFRIACFGACRPFALVL